MARAVYEMKKQSEYIIWSFSKRLHTPATDLHQIYSDLFSNT